MDNMVYTKSFVNSTKYSQVKLNPMPLETQSFKIRKKKKKKNSIWYIKRNPCDTSDQALNVNVEDFSKTDSSVSCLQRYADAENAFEQVLHLDKNCEEAVEELRQVRGYQLMVRLLLHEIYTLFTHKCRPEIQPETGCPYACIWAPSKPYSVNQTVAEGEC